MTLARCSVCKVRYPEEILSAMVTTAGTIQEVCGICALELGNKLMGITRTEFGGEMAEAMRQRAIEWRKSKGVN